MEQAHEVQSGLWLLQQALSFLRTSVTNTALHSHIDNSIRNLLSINAVLRSLNIQVSYSRVRYTFKNINHQLRAPSLYERSRITIRLLTNINLNKMAHSKQNIVHWLV